MHMCLWVAGLGLNASIAMVAWDLCSIIPWYPKDGFPARRRALKRYHEDSLNRLSSVKYKFDTDFYLNLGHIS